MTAFTFYNGAPACAVLDYVPRQIIIADAARRPTEVAEGPDVAVQEDVLALLLVGPAGKCVQRPTGRKMNSCTSAAAPAKMAVAVPKSDLGFFALGVVLGHGHLGQGELLAGAHLGHETAHGGLAHVGAVLFA